MHPPDYNLTLARAILSEFEPFLQSPDAFWPLSATSPRPGIPFPRLSLGALLLALAELRAAEADVDPAGRDAGQAVKREFDRIRQKWAVALEHKALSESSQRLSIWRAYLQDLSDARADPADYPREVRQRVVLARLLEVARQSPDSRTAIGSLAEWDSILRGLLIPGGFIWDARLKDVYPEEDFWFLYGTIRT
ncbi:MAG TPA: hypothetical protein VJK02_08720 [Anaerolineales bacterium]|nr:hypothetical protein [Anaerolineales bacterium]